MKSENAYAFEKDGEDGADADGNVGDAEANVDEGVTKPARKAADVFSGKKRTFGDGKANREKSSSGGVKKRRSK